MLTERDERRFYAKVALPNGQGCMLWLKDKNSKGYGQFRLNGRRPLAHRISYTLAYGEIPDGLVIDHVKARGCTSPLCVAPLHLEAVTQQENLLRGEGSTAINARKTHCPQDHEYTPENTYAHKGRRYCRACQQEATRRRRVRTASSTQARVAPRA